MSTAVHNALQFLDRLEAFPRKKLNRGQCEDLKWVRTILANNRANFESQRRLVAAEYRHKGGRLTEPHPQLLEDLTLKTAEWKQKQLPFDDKSLTAEDILHLRTLACYPHYLELLFKDPAALETFFKWSILNHLSVEIFVEFPLTTHKIDKSLLKSRIGAFANKALVMTENKDVTLLMEGKPESILDGNKSITLAKDLVMTVDQIFHVFRNKNLDEGFLTFFKDRGICNWDPHLFGPVNSKGEVEELDLTKPNWHMQLPVFEEISQQEAKERYGCDGTNWALIVVATRQTEKMNVTGAHSFIRLVIPCENGYRVTYGWGKFSKKYPQSDCDSKGYLMKPSQGTLEYPDNNETYTSRQKTSRHFLMTSEKGAACLESIRKDLLKVRANNFPFQILTHHCTEWVAKKVRKYVGQEESKLFDQPFFEIKVTGFLGKLVSFLAKTARWFKHLVLFLFACFLGGHKRLSLTKKDGSEKSICILKDPPWSKGKVFRHPGVAFQK